MKDKKITPVVLAASPQPERIAVKHGLSIQGLEKVAPLTVEMSHINSGENEVRRKVNEIIEKVNLLIDIENHNINKGR